MGLRECVPIPFFTECIKYASHRHKVAKGVIHQGSYEKNFYSVNKQNKAMLGLGQQ